MATYSNEEFRHMVAQQILDGELEPMTDNQGQLVIYTGLYENATTAEIQDEEDPDFDG